MGDPYEKQEFEEYEHIYQRGLREGLKRAAEIVKEWERERWNGGIRTTAELYAAILAEAEKGRQ